MLIVRFSWAAVPLLLAVSSLAAHAADSNTRPPDHAVEEHSYDRIEEVRRDRIAEPARAWAHPTGRDLSGAVDTPAGVRTPRPTSHGNEGVAS